MCSFLLDWLDKSKIEEVTDVVIGPTAWLTYKRRTSIWGSMSINQAIKQWRRNHHAGFIFKALTMSDLLFL
jgi:hypothetical protein